MADDLANAMDEVFSGEAAGPAPDAAPSQEPKEPEKPEAPKPDAAQPAPQLEEPKQEDHTVPLAKFLDQRDELKELRRFKAEQEAKAKPAPDPDDDPKGYAAHFEQRVEQKLTAQKFEMSDTIARQSHGAETVEKAAAWALEKAQNDPAFAAQYMRESHPIEWIVRQHKREGIMKQVGEDPDDFVRRRAAEMGLIAPPSADQPAAPQPPASKPPAPPKSLVNAPSGGGVSEIPVGPVAALDAVFTR
jgi:hypothetical protein